MGTAFVDQELREFTLSEQGIGGDGLAGNVHIFQQRDEHSDLVVFFDLISAVYGQRADFFWV